MKFDLMVGALTWQQSAQLAVDLQQFLIGIADDRRKNPQDDMISILVSAKLEAEDRHLTNEEMLGILQQFLVAGHETTTSTFGWGMLLMCRNPEIQEQMYENQKLIREMILQMKLGHLDTAPFSEKFGVNITECWKDEFDSLKEQGFLNYTDESIDEENIETVSSRYAGNTATAPLRENTGQNSINTGRGKNITADGCC